MPALPQSSPPEAPSDCQEGASRKTEVMLFVGAPTYAEVARVFPSGDFVEETDVEDCVKESFTALPEFDAAAPKASFAQDSPGPEWRVLRPSNDHLTSNLTQDAAWLPQPALAWSARSRWRQSFADLSFLTASQSDPDFVLDRNSFLESPLDRANGRRSQVDMERDDGELGDDEEEAEDLDKSLALHENPASSQITNLDVSETPAKPRNPFRPASPSSSEDEYGDSDMDELFSNLHSSKRRKSSASATAITSSPPAIHAATPARPATRPKQPPSQRKIIERLSAVPISSLPTASQILQMRPQTLTVNLVAALVAKQPTRSVTVHRTGAQVDLLEAFFSDDTRSGFAVSFWLAAPDAAAKQETRAGEDLRATLAVLRPGDVLLLRNIALTQYRGATYGQSLGRRYWRTAIRVLWRRGMAAGLPLDVDNNDDGDTGAGAPLYDSDDLADERPGGERAVATRARAVRAWAVRSIALPPIGRPLEEQKDARAQSRRRHARRSAVRGRDLLGNLVGDARPPDDSQPG